MTCTWCGFRRGRLRWVLVARAGLEPPGPLASASKCCDVVPWPVYRSRGSFVHARQAPCDWAAPQPGMYLGRMEEQGLHSGASWRYTSCSTLGLKEWPESSSGQDWPAVPEWNCGWSGTWRGGHTEWPESSRGKHHHWRIRGSLPQLSPLPSIPSSSGAHWVEQCSCTAYSFHAVLPRFSFSHTSYLQSENCNIWCASFYLLVVYL